MLDRQGLILATLMGIIIFAFADWRYLAVMLTFLALSVAVTKYEYRAKKEMGIYEHERSWENVLSNGAVPTLLAASGSFIGPLPYLASVAAITADKFASELGVLGGTPFSLENLRPVKQGKSGAVSLLGLAVSLAGGVLIGVSGMLLFDITPTLALFIGLCGFFGSFIDSIAGVFEEKGIGTKGTSNLICSASGALPAYLLKNYGLIFVGIL